MQNNNEVCEICGSKDFFDYRYPLDLKPFIQRIKKGAYRRYFVNLAKFFSKIAVKIIPGIFPDNFKKRALGSYKRIQLSKEINSLIKNIETGMELFKDKHILICKNCGLGIVSPRISEEKLIEHYKKDYWVSGIGEIEPAENDRTIGTYELLFKNINSDLDEILEFGSASAHLSRYFKSKQPNLIFDSVDPGLTWKEVLKDKLRNIYTDLKLVDNKYSLVMGSHSLEHVPNLEEYFNNFIKILKPGGYLYFEIPNSEEKELIFGPKPDFHFPHTYFFTQKSFNEIANKFGLDIVFNKTFSRSYSQRFNKTDKDILPNQENPNGAYLRVLLKLKNN
ncbi:MAG TPA: class I SAM-dependent methyltransferase [Candidatus Paceibacterota bacterium]|nr:class I SAM-dependent methyltransferase [Candidatus Paceibacterota bacterium]